MNAHVRLMDARAVSLMKAIWKSFQGAHENTFAEFASHVVKCGTVDRGLAQTRKAVQTNPFPRNWLAFLVEAVKKSKRLFSAFLWSVGEPLGHPQILRHCRSNGRVPRKLHVDTRSVIVCKR